MSGYKMFSYLTHCSVQDELNAKVIIWLFLNLGTYNAYYYLHFFKFQEAKLFLKNRSAVNSGFKILQATVWKLNAHHRYSVSACIYVCTLKSNRRIQSDRETKETALTQLSKLKFGLNWYESAFSDVPLPSQMCFHSTLAKNTKASHQQTATAILQEHLVRF